MSLDALLLEDDPSKKNRLLSFLSSRKDVFNRVDVALCTSDAIRLLEERQYDLLIADVVVPQEMGGEKSEDNCIAFFEQMDDGHGNFKLPSFSLPMSSSSTLSKAAHEFFRGRPWGILPYTDNSDECLSSVEKIAHFVLAEKNKATPDRSCDVFIITALDEPEFTSLEKLPIEWSAFEPLDDQHLMKRAVMEVNGVKMKIVSAFCSRMGPVAATILTTKAMLMLRPKLVIMSGICAGVPGKANIGDVISVDISWDWQSGKYIDKLGEEVFEIAPHQLVLDDKSRNQLLLLKRDTEFWGGIAAAATKQQLVAPKLVIGPMATGASVMADARVTQRIKSEQHKNVAGLDMETYGVLAAVAACGPSTRAISMKAVCDRGDVKKDDAYQEYAANISALAIYRLLEKHAGPLLG